MIADEEQLRVYFRQAATYQLEATPLPLILPRFSPFAIDVFFAR
jgi:hypothetical protein